MRGYGDRLAVGLLAALFLVPLACGTPTGEESGPEHVIAVLRSVAPSDSTALPILREELARRGFVEGRNLRILGSGDDQVYPDPEAAREAVEQWRKDGVELIVAYSTSAARVAADTAPDADILFMSSDPTLAGLVQDELRPEGRLTGVTYRVPLDRTLMLARRMMPELSRIGLPYPSDDPAAEPNRDRYAAEAASQGLELIGEAYTDEADLPRAVRELAGRGAQLLLLSLSPTATRAVPVLESAAREAALPVAANIDVSTIALLSLFPDSEALNLQLARQAVGLLNGASPSAIPVEDPRRFIFTLNARVAEQRGIELPEDVVREADLVIR